MGSPLVNLSPAGEAALEADERGEEGRPHPGGAVRSRRRRSAGAPGCNSYARHVERAARRRPAGAPSGNASDAEVLAWLRSEYNQPFTWGDFSYLEGRRLELDADKPWSYDDLAQQVCRTAGSILDVDTGDGGRYAAIVREVGKRRWEAVEGYPPHVALARARLEPLGADVRECRDETLPFEDATFDVVLNRHGMLRAMETGRVLRPGGMLVTQQVAEGTNRELRAELGATSGMTYARLEAERAALTEAGLHVEQGVEHRFTTRYFDAGAIAYYMKAIPWDVPDFSVDRYADALIRLHRQLDGGEPLDVGFHLILFVARKST